MFDGITALGLRRTGMTALAIGAAVLAVLPGADTAAAGENHAPGAVARPVPTTGTPPAGFSSWDEMAAVQQRLSGVSDRIHEAAEGPDGAGFGSVVAHPEARGLTVYWKGAVPATVRGLLGADPQVAVTVQPADYTERELQAAVSRLMATRPAASTNAAARVIAAGPRDDASGLQVEVTGDVAVARGLAGVRETGMPVTIEAGTLPHEASRLNDSPPYWGGARYSTSTGSCTTGFAVLQGTSTRMLSAGHCARAAGQDAFDGGGDLMGMVGTRAGGTLDALLINASSAGRVFNNDAAGNEFTNPVLGRHFNDVGGYVCTSGSFSGTRCNIKITDSGLTHDFTDSDGVVHTYSHLVKGKQQDGTNAAGNGDSGGPVFDVTSDGLSVYAKGTITGGSGSDVVPCTGVPSSSTRQCSSVVYWTSVTASMNGFGVSIVTG